MRVDSVFSGRRRLALVCAAVVWSAPALAQLSSPMPGVPGVPAGTGAGVHGANSPFAPLKERADVLPWSVLTAVKTKTEKNRLLPVFTADIQALHKKTQRIQGFMMPLEPGEKQKHFLISSVPLTCSFCVAGGPESMIEVKTKTAVKYSMEAVVVEGQFAVLNDDPYGLYYRMTDAVAVK
ncbi:hypothetical protein MCEZEM1_00472 [Comamonadaceae bacterium]